MVRIAITKEAHDAVVATLPIARWPWSRRPLGRGRVEPAVVNKLTRMRAPGETFSHVMMRLAAVEDESLNGS
jgi:hypothetical protein